MTIVDFVIILGVVVVSSCLAYLFAWLKYSSEVKTYELPRKIGVLRIDRSDDYDGPYMFLELNQDIDDFCKEEQVLLDILDENYPQ